MFVIIEKDTKKVYTVCDKNDFVPEDNHEVHFVEGMIKDLKLDHHPCFYIYDKEKGFVLSQEALDTESQRLANIEAAKTKKEQNKLSAIDKLTKLGLTKEEIEALTN